MVKVLCVKTGFGQSAEYLRPVYFFLQIFLAGSDSTMIVFIQKQETCQLLELGEGEIVVGLDHGSAKLVVLPLEGGGHRGHVCSWARIAACSPGPKSSRMSRSLRSCLAYQTASLSMGKK